MRWHPPIINLGRFITLLPFQPQQQPRPLKRCSGGVVRRRSTSRHLTTTASNHGRGSTGTGSAERSTSINIDTTVPPSHPPQNVPQSAFQGSYDWLDPFQLVTTCLTNGRSKIPYVNSHKRSYSPALYNYIGTNQRTKKVVN